MTDDTGHVAPRECFVIAPIGPEGSPIRTRSDQILNHVIRPVVEERGYRAVRGDEISSSGLITSQVIKRIIGDDLVVADLTDHNANVFYELAVRHAVGRPFVQLLDKSQQLPFDVQDMRAILIDHRDLDSVARAKAALGRAIDDIIREPELVTPVSLGLTLYDLRGSSNPSATMLSQIMTALQELAALPKAAPRAMTLLEEIHASVAASAPVVVADDHDDSHRHLRRLLETYAAERGFTRGDTGADPESDDVAAPAGQEV